MIELSGRIIIAITTLHAVAGFVVTLNEPFSETGRIRKAPRGTNIVASIWPLLFALKPKTLVPFSISTILCVVPNVAVRICGDGTGHIGVVQEHSVVGIHYKCVKRPVLYEDHWCEIDGSSSAQRRGLDS